MSRPARRAPRVLQGGKVARLLVTNCTMDPTTGGVYLVDTDLGLVRRVLARPTRGITVGPDGCYAVGHYGEIHRLDPDGWTATLVAELDLIGTHDLRWVGSEFFLVASPGNW